MKRAISHPSRCLACQSTVLEAFTAAAGVPIRYNPRPSSIKPVPYAIAQRRPSSYSRRLLFNTKPQTQNHASPDDSTTPASGTPVPSSKPDQPSSLPWYLQVETPTPPASSLPLAQVQELPPLPPHPPSILQPILSHLYETAGLDNLTLVDLRHLQDPPPALGANLIMLICTARSVKHLNVSADRFCRWLRSEYRLRPYADGLLGRQELKLKLRRKARRLRLAQSVGALEREQAVDDGITTGWICVNLGQVPQQLVARSESPALEAVQDGSGGDHVDVEVDDRYRNQTITRELAPEEGVSREMEFGAVTGDMPSEAESNSEQDAVDGFYIGFGSRSTDPRIVVQMFTQERRAEIDLEGLWDIRTIRRAVKAQKVYAEEEASLDGDVDVDVDLETGGRARDSSRPPSIRLDAALGS